MLVSGGGGRLGVTIERLRADEGPLLRELRLAALADSPTAFGQRLDEAAAQADDEWQTSARAASSGDRRAWFIARLDGRAVGLVQGRRRPPHDCLVFSMWVAPDARRTGAGRALLDAVDEWASGWGGRQVVLWVIAGNDLALGFYRRLGFKLLRSGPDASSGIVYGALAMSRPIRRSVAGAAGGQDVG
jgi:GNAT superfamily N-acetyltransferase